LKRHLLQQQLDSHNDNSLKSGGKKSIVGPKDLRISVTFHRKIVQLEGRSLYQFQVAINGDRDGYRVRKALPDFLMLEQALI